MGSSHTEGPNTFSTPTTWATSTYFMKDRQVFHNSELYIASAGHTSAAATEPGVGVNWATVWTVASYGMTANQNAAMNTATALDGTHPPLVKDSDITTAKLTVIANTSGTNTGDETAARISTLTTFLTVVAAEAATGLADNERYYVVENDATYRVETAGSAYTRDGFFVLNTGDGGDTRLLAVAGKYVLNDLNTLGSAVVTKASADAVGASIGGKKSRGTSAVPVVVTTGDVLSEFYGEGFDGTNFLKMGAIQVVSTGTIAGTRVPTKIVFYTATDATPSVLTQRAWLDSAGNFVVGNPASVGAKHHVYDNTTTAQPVGYFEQDNASNTNVVFKIRSDGTGDLLQLVKGTTIVLWADQYGQIYSISSIRSRKAGSDTSGSGPFFRIGNADETNSWSTQLSASNNMDFWYYNGSTAQIKARLLTTGGFEYSNSELVEAATIGLTAAKCMNTAISNYGQADDITYTLPAAAKGLAFTFLAGTTVAKYVRFDPNASEVIYLNGTALAGGAYIGIASIVAGMRVKFECFQTGASAYAWRATTLDAFASE